MEEPFVVLTFGLGFTMGRQSVDIGDIPREDDALRLLLVKELADFALPLRALGGDVDIVQYESFHAVST